jgi:hypothetical protein
MPCPLGALGRDPALRQTPAWSHDHRVQAHDQLTPVDGAERTGLGVGARGHRFRRVVHWGRRMTRSDQRPAMTVAAMTMAAIGAVARTPR